MLTYWQLLKVQPLLCVLLDLSNQMHIKVDVQPMGQNGRSVMRIGIATPAEAIVQGET